MWILNEIRREKYRRRHELLVIDRRKHKLSEWKKRLEQMQYDLAARETRIQESEPFLPLARQLQEMKLALEHALHWIETILEKKKRIFLRGPLIVSFNSTTVTGFNFTSISYIASSSADSDIPGSRLISLTTSLLWYRSQLIST